MTSKLSFSEWEVSLRSFWEFTYYQTIGWVVFLVGKEFLINRGLATTIIAGVIIIVFPYTKLFVKVSE